MALHRFETAKVQGPHGDLGVPRVLANGLQCLLALRRVPSRDDQAAARARQGGGSWDADATGGTGDDDGLALEIQVLVATPNPSKYLQIP